MIESVPLSMTLEEKLEVLTTAVLDLHLHVGSWPDQDPELRHFL